MPWWYGPWDAAWWLLVPFVMCFVMMPLMFLMRGSRRTHHWHPPDTTDDAVQTLRRRFASGELTQEEFEDRKKVLLTPSEEGRGAVLGHP